MKKVFIAISLLLLSSGSRLAAQTIMDSNTAYKEFVRLANEDTDKVLTYDALYRCYAATYVVMTTSEKTSSEYSQATYNMTHILPFLPNAAAFYSRGMSAGNAVKFARAFVDVANLPAFADGGYRSQTAYAQLSYYAAASLVNQRQYGEAIPYLQSYIRSGEDKYRKTVFINLVKACAASNQYDLAIVTLAFGEIVKNVMNACYLGLDSHGLHFSLKDTASLNMEMDGKVLINGAMGITGIKKASTFAVGIVLVIITLLVILNLVNSRAGRAIKAIRDNEIAARSVGIPITKYKLMAFVTSAVFAGIAGVLYALNYSSLVAKKFDYNTSILILVFVVLGGIGNLRGSVIAAAVLTVLPELLRSMNDYRMLIYAIVLIVVMIFNQSPEMIALRKRLTARFRKEGTDKKDAKEKKGVA